MKVLHVIAPGALAGAERVVLAGSAAQVERGLSVCLAVIVETRLPTPGLEFIALAESIGLKTHAVHVRGQVDSVATERLRALIGLLEADVVHLHGFKALFLTPMEGSAARVATHHGDTGHTARVRAYELLTRLRYQHVDLVATVSQSAYRLLRRAGLRDEVLEVAPNLLAIDATPRCAGERHGKLKVLSFGRLSVEKGLDVLLRAVASLPAHARPKLRIAGEGPARANLEALATSLAIDGDVEFLGWLDDVRPEIIDCDAVAMPSRTEGQPLAAIEAVVVGRPIVASAVGDLPELIDDGLNGYLVPSCDPDALADALVRCHEDRAARLSYAGAHATAMAQQFGAGRWASRSAALYVKAIANRNRSFQHGRRSNAVARFWR